MNSARSPLSRPVRAAAATAGVLALAFGVPLAAAAVGVDVPDPISVVRASAGRAAPHGCGDRCRTAAATPAATASASAAPTTASPQSGTSAERIVATVARCAPRGHDELFSVTGELRTHGDFVAAAAAGDTLALPFGSYDLATLAGAQSLCDALAGQRAAMSSASASPRPDRPRASRSATPRPERSRDAQQSARPERSREPRSSARPDRSRGSTARPTRSR